MRVAQGRLEKRQPPSRREGGWPAQSKTLRVNRSIERRAPSWRAIPVA
jgi:hypothetical protein